MLRSPEGFLVGLAPIRRLSRGVSALRLDCQSIVGNLKNDLESKQLPVEDWQQLSNRLIAALAIRYPVPASVAGVLGTILGVPELSCAAWPMVQRWRW